MTDKIILNIRHSDDYSDYLLMTAGLTNKRIIPMVNPSSEKLKAATDCNTKVLRCFVIREPLNRCSSPVSGGVNDGAIRINSLYYLEDDGTINYANVEIVRQIIEELARQILLSSENLTEAYRRYFPRFWKARQKIYADPKLFFVNSGVFGEPFYQDGMPIGAILKAMDEDPRTFEIRLSGCNCHRRPLIIDYERICGEHWILYTWCPVCSSRREIRAWNFHRSYQCEKAVEDARAYYDKGRVASQLSLFDLVDELGLS